MRFETPAHGNLKPQTSNLRPASVLSHDRRRIVHFNVTGHPHSQWTRLQILQALPWNTAPSYLLRDRQGVFDPAFSRLVETLGTEEVLIQARKPWQNPFVERLIGSIRKDYLDHVIIMNERHLYIILKEYLDYYHDDRPHQGLHGDTPAGRPVEPRPSPDAQVVGLPRLGGLHHRYIWQNAA